MSSSEEQSACRFPPPYESPLSSSLPERGPGEEPQRPTTRPPLTWNVPMSTGRRRLPQPRAPKAKNVKNVPSNSPPLKAQAKAEAETAAVAVNPVLNIMKITDCGNGSLTANHALDSVSCPDLLHLRLGVECPTDSECDCEESEGEEDVGAPVDATVLTAGQESRTTDHAKSTLVKVSPGVLSGPIMERKVLDMKRWYCISRPQYKASCGMSSVVSVWNYLFSTIGQGSLRPITQEEALDVVGFAPPFGEIRFGPFTGNSRIMQWFHELNAHFGVSGLACILFKPQGLKKTRQMTAEKALVAVKDVLRSEDMALVYHCQNHYFCPIGFEDTPLKSAQAYHSGQLGQDDVRTWILIGDTSSTNQPILSARWTDILKDLESSNPTYFDIRHPERGFQTRRTRKIGGNLHCLMKFKRGRQRPRPAVMNGKPFSHVTRDETN